MPKLLDTIDRRILRALQADGRLPNTELAAQVGLSPSPINEWPSWCATTRERIERIVSAKRDCGPLKE